ncbi:hypothetical protein JCM10212_007070 [Sporobolomyces blumeae]
MDAAGVRDALPPAVPSVAPDGNAGLGKADKQRRTLPPISTDFAYAAEPASRPRSPTSIGPASPKPPRPASRNSVSSQRKHPHYQHHEAAPRRLIKKLNSLLHGNLHRKHHSQRNGGIHSPFNGSSTALSRGNSIVSTSSALSRVPFSAEPEKLPSESPSIEDQRPFIKIRLATFNMHDTLPTSDGDFSDWLGDVSTAPPPAKKRKRSSMSSRNSTMTIPMDKVLPKFPLNAEHPYHIIVVASQECPTASGVLAGRVRTLDGRGWTNMLENYLCGGSCYDSDSGSDSSSSSEGDDRERRDPDDPGGAPLLDERSLHAKSFGQDDPSADSGSVSAGSRPPTSHAHRDDEVRSQAASTHGSNSGDSRRRRGPYVLVEKERLMGIYIAVFVARSCEDLVEGVSKSRVPAGLIGGRVGNKGGVGVSLHFANSRLLFVSAHLAAHASAIEIRKANVLKIFEELDVDDFWAASGRMGPKPKHVTDRFDQTFFLGDLNFRLNVTRLHSDWLIARKEYTTALQFDQLRDVLAEPASVFTGFAEGEIKFAPTYKYDVVHRVKKKRSTILGGGRHRRQARDGAKVPFPSPNPETTEDSGSVSDPEIVHGSKSIGDEDTLSVISSVGTISTLDGFDQIERNELDKGDLSSLGLPTPPKKGGETHMDAVRNAQVRFLTLVKSNSAAAAAQYSRKRSSSIVPKTAPPIKTMFNPPRPVLQASQSALVVPMTRSTSAPLGLSSKPSEIGALDRSAETTDGEGESKPLKALRGKVESFVPAVEPVFDSSSKQRVQSYTDRILFKSTIEPPAEEEDVQPVLPVNPSIPLQPSRSAAIVSVLRDLTHPHVGPLGAGARSPSNNHEEERGLSSRRGSAEDRHLRFGDIFTKPRRKSVSSDTAVDEAANSTEDRSQDLPRTKSLQPTQLRRHHSGENSVATDDSADGTRKKAFWRRVASFPALTSTVSPSSPKLPSTPSISSPLNSPSMSTAPNSPNVQTPTTSNAPSYFASTPPGGSGNSTPVRRKQRRMFTLTSDSPPSSPEETRQGPRDIGSGNSSPPSRQSPILPRSNSEQAVPSSFAHHQGHRSSSSNIGFPRYVTTSAIHRPIRTASGSHLPSPSPPQAASTTPPIQNVPPPNHTSSASLNTRFKSFLNSIPLPFLNAPAPGRSLSATTDNSIPARRKVKYGPRPGEIQVLKYDSVADLARMGAVSDHRPVWLACAVGVEEPRADDEDDA